MLVILIIIGLVGVLLALSVRQTRFPRLRNLSMGLLITYSFLVALLAAGELYFRYVFAESDGVPTLAMQNWIDRYWHLNSANFRDAEWQPETWEGRESILLIGDSFTAGWGIENSEDRFGDVLARELGDAYVVLNLGKEGASTVEELEILREAPIQNPDIVILQYTLNDIEIAALSIGLDPGLNPMSTVPFWAQDSYLGNFLYWRLAIIFAPQNRGSETYQQFLYNMFDHSVVWEIHFEQLAEFARAVEARGAELYIVIFPDLFTPFNSIPYVDRVAQAFESLGYDEERIIRLFDFAETFPLEERVVSMRDGHPSAAFSTAVGEMLYQEWFLNTEAGS